MSQPARFIISPNTTRTFATCLFPHAVVPVTAQKRAEKILSLVNGVNRRWYTGEKTVHTRGNTIPQYRFLPGNNLELVERKKSAILTLQEWWGVNDQIKMHAQRIADGTRALVVVPDIYKGKLGLSQKEASHLKSSLDWKQALTELEALVDSLREEAYTHIASIGFCMGGALSLALASRLSVKVPLSATITCYGVPKATQCDLSVIAVKTPVQGHFGNEDKMVGFSDPRAANLLERQLEEGIELHTGNGVGKAIEICRYDGEGHAFLNNEEWARQRRVEMGFVGGDNKETQNLAWQRIFKFLGDYLE